MRLGWRGRTKWIRAADKGRSWMRNVLLRRWLRDDAKQQVSTCKAHDILACEVCMLDEYHAAGKRA